MTRIGTLEHVFGTGKGRAHLRPVEIPEGLTYFCQPALTAFNPSVEARSFHRISYKISRFYFWD